VIICEIIVHLLVKVQTVLPTAAFEILVSLGKVRVPAQTTPCSIICVTVAIPIMYTPYAFNTALQEEEGRR